jgi:hypothetical protein
MQQRRWTRLTNAFKAREKGRRKRQKAKGPREKPEKTATRIWLSSLTFDL